MHTLPSPLDPRIGILNRAVGIAFYAYDRGYDHEPVKGSLNEVERALGVPLSTSSVPPQANPVSTAGTVTPLQKKRTRGSLQRYSVTAKPDVVLYAGSTIFGETVEEVDAVSSRDAIKQVRSQLRETNGRYGPRYTFSATRVGNT